MKAVGVAVGAFVLTVVVIVGLWAGGLVFQEKTASFRGRVDVANKTKANGNYRIAAYDHFFDLCVSVQNAEASISAQRDELATDPSDERKGQISANIAALKAARASAVNQYNADARKAGTIGQFRDSGLPPVLDQTTEGTTCAA